MKDKNGRRACEFQLLRYVPDAVRNEYVHIGVILREQGGEAPAAVRFTHDWRRVRCLDPEADTALLEGMESELRRQLQEDPEGKLMRLLDESLSLSVQMTEAKAYLAESLPAGMEELMRLYVEPPPRERVPRLSGRAGDPLRIDVGYRPNGVIRMFHAVSLEPGVEMAKVLAFSAAGLRTGVERVEKAQLELTAVIEPAAKLGATEEEPERLEMYRFGVETMEEHQIRVLTTSDLGRVADTARRELRV
jgi:hypothetical protein